jgi:hypothetical protein
LNRRVAGFAPERIDAGPQSGDVLAMTTVHIRKKRHETKKDLGRDAAANSDPGVLRIPDNQTPH